MSDDYFFPVVATYDKGRGTATCEGWFAGEVHGGEFEELVEGLLEEMFFFREEESEIEVLAKGKGEALQDWLSEQRSIDCCVRVGDVVSVESDQFAGATRRSWRFSSVGDCAAPRSPPWTSKTSTLSPAPFEFVARETNTDWSTCPLEPGFRS